MNPSQHAEQFQSQLANYVPQFTPEFWPEYCWLGCGWCWGCMPCFVLVA